MIIRKHNNNICIGIYVFKLVLVFSRIRIFALILVKFFLKINSYTLTIISNKKIVLWRQQYIHNCKGWTIMIELWTIIQRTNCAFYVRKQPMVRWPQLRTYQHNISMRLFSTALSRIFVILLPYPYHLSLLSCLFSHSNIYLKLQPSY